MICLVINFYESKLNRSIDFAHQVVHDIFIKHSSDLFEFRIDLHNTIVFSILFLNGLK